MARSAKQLANLKKGKATQFKPGEEQAKISKKGAEAAAKVHRQKKTMRELTKMLLSLPVTDPKGKEILKGSGIPDEECTNALWVLAGIMHRSSKGDAAAAKVLLTLQGEYSEKQEITGADGAPFEGIKVVFDDPKK